MTGEVSMQSPETVHVERSVRRYFWLFATLILLVIVVAVVGVAWNRPQAPANADLSNAELVEQFRAFENVSTAGGTCWVAVDPFADDSFLIETIAIDQDVPSDLWHTLVQRGDPGRVFLYGITLTEADWRVLSSIEPLYDLELTDCSFEGAFVSLDQMENLEWLEITRSRDDGVRLSEGLLDVLIESLPSAPRLTHLYLWFAPLTDEHLERLVKNAPQLEVISLFGMTQADGIQHFSKLANLHCLMVDALSDSDFPVLDTFPKLNWITIGEVTSVGFCIKLFEEVDSLDALHLPPPFCSETFNEDELINLNSNGIGFETLPSPVSIPYLYRLPSS